MSISPTRPQPAPEEVGGLSEHIREQLATNVHFSSKKLDYLTPQSLLEYLYEVFTFDLDPCSDQPHHLRPNVRAAVHYTQVEDGLAMPWHGVCFMNPPYGRQIGHWVARAVAQIENGNVTTVVCLVPARVDTRWWQDNIEYASFIVFIKGRLKFSGHTNSAPFPSALVVFGAITDSQKAHLAKLGWSVWL